MNNTVDDSSSPQPIPTEYAGLKFRSRLEARWALFFDLHNIQWRYEAEGYELPSGRYLPDFVLPECGTFIEVRGDISRVDVDHLVRQATELPRMTPSIGEPGPKMMLLGPIPRVDHDRDLGWMSFEHDGVDVEEDGTYWLHTCGFGDFRKNHRPWWLCQAADFNSPLVPVIDPTEHGYANDAYRQARKHSFWNPR